MNIAAQLNTAAATSVAKLSVRDISRSFSTRGKNVEALKGVSFEVPSGSFYSIIGHSGCGKSTLLNIVAGLDQATSGVVAVDGVVRRSPGPDRGMVFQS